MFSGKNDAYFKDLSRAAEMVCTVAKALYPNVKNEIDEVQLRVSFDPKRRAFGGVKKGRYSHVTVGYGFGWRASYFPEYRAFENDPEIGACQCDPQSFESLLLVVCHEFSHAVQCSDWRRRERALDGLEMDKAHGQGFRHIYRAIRGAATMQMRGMMA